MTAAAPGFRPSLREAAFHRLAVLLLLLCPAWAQNASEERLQAIWDTHQATPQLHEQVIALCRDFARSRPGDLLLPVAQGLQTWHLLQDGKEREALQLVDEHLQAAGGDAVTAAARRLAQAWKSRSLRNQVVQALQTYYRKEVAYPPSLAGLERLPGIPEAQRPPLADAFGTPWTYRLTGFQKLPGFENQRYLLESAALGPSSGLAEALRLPYASGISAVPERVAEETPLPKVILRTAAGSGLLVPGQELGGVSLAFAGRKLVILANHSYWKVYPRP